jgi:hypothetical protein
MQAQAILGGPINQATINTYAETNVSLSILDMECAPSEAPGNIDALTSDKLGFMQNQSPGTKAFGHRISAMESIGLDVLKAALTRQ